MNKYKRACVPGSNAMQWLQWVKLPDKQSPRIVQGGAEILALQWLGSALHALHVQEAAIPQGHGLAGALAAALILHSA